MAGAPDTPAFDGKLVFRRPADGSGKLVFGDQGGASGTSSADIAIDAGFAADLRAMVVIARVVPVGIDAGFADDMPASIGAVRDANAFRSTLARAEPRFQDAVATGADTRAAWRQSSALGAAGRAGWQNAAPIAADVRNAWQSSTQLAVTGRPAFRQGLPAASGVRGSFQQAIALRAAGRPAFERALPIAPGIRAGFQQTISLRAGARAVDQYARAIESALRAPLRTALPAWSDRRARFQQARYPLPGLSPAIVIPPPEKELCYDPARLGLLVFRTAYTGDGQLVFICTKSGGTTPPVEPPGAIVVLRRRSYVVINDLQIRTVPGGALLPVNGSGFSMRLEQGSWTWGFQFTAHAAARALVQPGPGGDPAELEVTLNGQPFRMLVEGITQSVRFPRAEITVRGRGLAALLDAPRAPVQSFAQPDMISAQQLALQVLTANGVSLGWQVDWQLTDWTIPAGTWAYNGTWIGAVGDIAAAVGAYVQPHDTDRTLRILPAWPVAAWDLPDAAPDLELPAGIATVEEVEWIDKPAYDAIDMQGTPGNKLYFRNRAGTPGDNPAPMIVHALMVDAAAAQQRARAALSDTGRQVEQRLNLMVLPETGVIHPGTVLRYTDDTATKRTGIVRATSVSQAGPRIEQSITVQAPA